MIIFTLIAILAIAASGIVSAFRARHAERLVMWLVAYLVLIEGLMQLGLVAGWHQLKLPVDGLAITLFIAYTIGNVAVMAGRVYKNKLRRAHYLVYGGGALLMAAVIVMAAQFLQVQPTWTRTGVLALIFIIVVSTPVGMVLSTPSNKAKK